MGLSFSNVFDIPEVQLKDGEYDDNVTKYGESELCLIYY